MILKGIANITIILCSGYIGMMLASRIDERIRQLKDAEGVLSRLEFNIGFLALPFAEALQRAASEGGALQSILYETAVLMKKKPEISAGDALGRILEKQGGILQITTGDAEIIQEFMNNIGKGDSENARDGIRLTEAKLKLAREEAEALKNRDGKLYRGLGYLAGMFLVVLLI